MKDLSQLSLNRLYYLLWKARDNFGEYWGDTEYDILEEIKRREKDSRPR